ncbi:DsbA family protein [Micromonospora sp. M12]
MRGSLDAPVTVVEYGDFECPYCGQAESVVRELLADFANVRYVWRHLPLTDVHPHAQLAAEAAEAAGEQGAFWEMHDLLLAHQDALDLNQVLGYGEQLGLDLDGFREHMAKRMAVDRIAEDVDSADLSGVTGTPTFFINGRRHHGAYDMAALSAAVKAAFASAKLRPSTTLVIRGGARTGRRADCGAGRSPCLVCFRAGCACESCGWGSCCVEPVELNRLRYQGSRAGCRREPESATGLNR